MHTTRNGYVGGALLMIPTIKELRAYVEFEKYQCRVLVDDDRTKEMKLKTENHPNKLFKFRYNNENSEKLTAAGRKQRGVEPIGA